MNIKTFSALRASAAPLALVVAGITASAAFVAPAMAQDVTAANLSGTVVDDSGKAVSGAMVEVTSIDRGSTRTTTTSANGTFSLPGMQVGTYNVTVMADGYTTTRSENVRVGLGGNNYDFTVSSEAPATGEIVVRGAPVRKVDFSGTATGIVFDVQKVAETVPVGRSIEAIQLLTPQVTSGDTAFGGVSIAGSSVAENVYYINGMNITNFRTFVGGTTVPFEFYDQIQVKTGGYQAEFGRNTGGAVIALTRSGSNTFHGGFNVYYQPEWGYEQAPDTYAQQNSKDKREVIEGNIWASGPIIKDRLFFFGFFNPRHYSQTDVADNGDVTTRVIKDPFYGGKVDLNLFDGHRVEATYFNDSQNEDVELNGSPTTNYSGGSNYIVKYTGAFTDWFTLSALYGKSKFNQTSAGADDSTPYVLDGRTGVLNYIAGNPAGTIDTGRDQRTNYRIDADLSFTLLGEHNLRAGWDLEKLQADNFTIYSGGTYNRYYRSGASGALSGLIAPNTDYVRVRTLNSGGSFQSENTAFYIQDSWDVTDRVNLSIGVRNDKFVNKDGLGAPFTELKNQWAPRLGINFDPTGDKTARISAFYGRYYLPVAANTNIRLAGSETFLQDWYSLPTGAGGVYSGDLINPTLGTKVLAEVLSPGGVSDPSTLVSKNIKPQYLDEFIVGGEYNFPNRMKISANFTYRKLGAVLEDVDLDGSGNYDSVIAAFCATQSQSWCNGTSVPTIGSGGYVLMNPGKDLIVNVSDDDGNLHEITMPASFIGLPEAKRTYWAAELKWERPFENGWGLTASYVWSRSKGNYEGGVKSDNGQDDTGLTQDFDEIGWVDGSNGYLPNHREHTFKVFGNWKPTDRWNLGFNALIQSPRKFGCIGTYSVGDGRATDTLASSWYCDAQIAAGNIDGTLGKPVGRGNVFSSDWNKRVDLSFAYTIPMESIAGGITLRADVFNVFNFKSKLDFNEFGDLDDVDTINPNYRAVTGYQVPRYFRFGVSANF
ncbi:TonB-dependent receptor [Novosphingobium sp. SL115]|uniref:TonB-dependent receptor n=1 Tax=Novosphingobium sp. SL115 TaxID=2995150 RepID=UPI0022747C5D|nr:TonB-dependent receptor [Novosphingobium sp. SL115]MCY1670280.1 TonB-dependent receptor [Novosphingobium sp. SL115]